MAVISGEKRTVISGEKGMLYHWYSWKYMIQSFVEENLRNFSIRRRLSPYVSIGRDHIVHFDYIARVESILERYNPGDEAWDDAMEQVALWYADKHEMTMPLFQTGSMVKVHRNWVGYELVEPWEGSTLNLVESVRGQYVEFGRGDTGFIAGERLILGLPRTKNERAVRFQKALLVVMTIQGSESLGYDDSSNPLGPPQVLETGSRVKTLISYFNPVKRPRNHPFIEWER